jgi:YggT family protein
MGQILLYAIQLYEIVLIVRVLMSWIRPDPYHPFVRFIYNITEPVLEPIRRILPTGGIGLDLSPLIVFLLLHLLTRALFGGFGGVF